MSEVCSVCNWTNDGCLNVGDYGKPKWICHGCIKRSLDTLQSKLTEVEECLRWASENVWLQRWPERSHEERWTAYPLGVSKWHNAPTLYQALHSAWEGRDRET